jgi:hypothetical protein
MTDSGSILAIQADRIITKLLQRKIARFTSSMPSFVMAVRVISSRPAEPKEVSTVTPCKVPIAGRVSSGVWAAI